MLSLMGRARLFTLEIIEPLCHRVLLSQERNMYILYFINILHLAQNKLFELQLRVLTSSLDFSSHETKIVCKYFH